MKNKKLVTLILSLSLVVAFIAGCTNIGGNELLNAFKKVSTINSMESNTNLKFNIDAQGLSQADQQSFDDVKGMINDVQINLFTKFKQNDTKTAMKSYTRFETTSDIFPLKTEVWLNQDFSGKTPIAKEIIKSPQAFSLSIPPKFTNKYMVIDLEQLKKNPDTKDAFTNVDFSKISQSNNELKEKIAEFVDKYVSSYDLGIDILTDKGTSQVNGVDAHLYELKLTDANFKTLIRKVFNDYSQNKEAMDFIKAYMLSSIQSSGLKGTELDNATKEIDQLFTEIGSENTKTQFNSTMDKLDAITLLGDKGIDITYAINNDGYIVNEKGTIQLVVDVKKLDQLSNELSGTNNTTSQAITGIYTIELNFDTNNYNINALQDKDFTYPSLTKQNSFTLEQLMAELNPKPPVKPTAVLYKSKSAKLYKKVYYVKVSDTVAKIKGSKYTYSRGNATIKINGKTIKLFLGRKYVSVNGKTVKLKTINGIIVKKKLYIPTTVFNLAGVNIKLK